MNLNLGANHERKEPGAFFFLLVFMRKYLFDLFGMRSYLEFPFIRFVVA